MIKRTYSFVVEGREEAFQGTVMVRSFMPNTAKAIEIAMEYAKKKLRDNSATMVEFRKI